MRLIGYIYLATEHDALIFQDDTGLDLPADVELLVFADDDRPESVTVEVTLDEKTQTLEAPARLILQNPHFTHW